MFDHHVDTQKVSDLEFLGYEYSTFGFWRKGEAGKSGVVLRKQVVLRRRRSEWLHGGGKGQEVVCEFLESKDRRSKGWAEQSRYLAPSVAT